MTPPEAAAPPEPWGAWRTVFVRRLRLEARIGVNPDEQHGPQPVVVDLVAEVADDPASGVGPDRLGRVVDYDRLVGAARAAAGGAHVRLAETLAERIAAGVLAAEPRVARVAVTLEKPRAVPDAEAAGVTVRRMRTGPR